MMKFQLSQAGRSVLLFFFSFLSGLVLYGQGDSSIMTGNKVVTLKEVVVRNNLDAAAFILRVKEDTSFYKAFKNLRILTYTSLNDIRVLDKKNGIRASLNSRTRQHRRQGTCCQSAQESQVEARRRGQQQPAPARTIGAGRGAGYHGIRGHASTPQAALRDRDS